MKLLHLKYYPLIAYTISLPVDFTLSLFLTDISTVHIKSIDVYTSGKHVRKYLWPMHKTGSTPLRLPSRNEERKKEANESPECWS